MNKRQKEILQHQLTAEEQELKRLKAVYNKAMQDIDDSLAQLLGRDDATLQHVIYQIDYQKALKKQVGGILDELNSNQFTSISEYLAECYENGFVSTMYDCHGQGVPILAPINQNQVITAIKHESKISEGLYKKLGVDTDNLKQRISNNISRGIASGHGYAQIAKNIAEDGKVGYNNAARIAQTDGARIHNAAAFDAQKEAKKKGADILKQWNSTLDGGTRPSHRRLDGQLRELDEPFEIDGHTAMHPLDFGIASEDINCRCSLLQRARWALEDDELETLKERAAYYGLDKTKGFDDFKKKYLKAVEPTVTETDKKAIFDYMGAKSYIVNDKLRNGRELTSEEVRFRIELDNALDKMPVYSGNLQRSVYFMNDDSVKEFLKDYTMGGTIVYKEYLSTTKGAVYNPDGQVQIYIQDSKNGKDISEFNGGEDEVLYKRESAFHIANMVEQNGVHYILLVEEDE